MPDISQHTDYIATLIYAQYEKSADQKARTYLGASVIGGKCSRALWYAFRFAKDKSFDGRMLRLFRTGDLEEVRMVKDLRAIGATVYDMDPATGKQFEFVGHHGHMKGHMDGCAKNLPEFGGKWAVLEFKTHNAKSFKDLQAKGVEKSKPEHYAQMQWYMGKSGMSRALYLAKCKDDEQLYSEKVAFDPVEFERIEAKAESIIFSDTPPAKISDDPKFYICNMCNFNEICHQGAMPAVSCRTCVHSTPERTGTTDGEWSCSKEKKAVIPIQLQRTGCQYHLPLPYLLTYADAIDAGDGWIMFARKDNGTRFVVADAPNTPTADAQTDVPVYTTHEISAARDHRMIGSPDVEQIRSAFPGAKIVG